MTAPKPLKNNDGVLCVRTRAAIAAALVNRPSREAAFGGELTCLSGAQGKVSLQLAGHSHPSGELAG